MAKKLWTKNFTLIIVATTLGAMGGVAGNFALSFLVFEEIQTCLSVSVCGHSRTGQAGVCSGVQPCWLIGRF